LRAPVVRFRHAGTAPIRLADRSPRDGVRPCNVRIPQGSPPPLASAVFRRVQRKLPNCQAVCRRTDIASCHFSIVNGERNIPPIWSPPNGFRATLRCDEGQRWNIVASYIDRNNADYDFGAKDGHRARRLLLAAGNDSALDAGRGVRHLRGEGKRGPLVLAGSAVDPGNETPTPGSLESLALVFSMGGSEWFPFP